MAIKEITPHQAYDMLANEIGCVYIDVRTVGEFSSGHPDGAVNVPIAFSDPAQGMVMNREFLRVMQTHFTTDKRIIVGCQAGPRSNAAAQVLQEAGYQDISNVLGGFGDWSSLNLPVSQENGEGISYESMAVEAK